MAICPSSRWMRPKTLAFLGECRRKSPRLVPGNSLQKSEMSSSKSREGMGWSKVILILVPTTKLS